MFDFLWMISKIYCVDFFYFFLLWSIIFIVWLGNNIYHSNASLPHVWLSCELSNDLVKWNYHHTDYNHVLLTHVWFLINDKFNLLCGLGVTFITVKFCSFMFWFLVIYLITLVNKTTTTLTTIISHSLMFEFLINYKIHF